MFFTYQLDHLSYLTLTIWWILDIKNVGYLGHKSFN